MNIPTAWIDDIVNAPPDQAHTIASVIGRNGVMCDGVLIVANMNAVRDMVACFRESAATATAANDEHKAAALSALADAIDHAVETARSIGSSGRPVPPMVTIERGLIQ